MSWGEEPGAPGAAARQPLSAVRWMGSGCLYSRWLPYAIAGEIAGDKKSSSKMAIGSHRHCLSSQVEMCRVFHRRYHAAGQYPPVYLKIAKKSPFLTLITSVVCDVCSFRGLF